MLKLQRLSDMPCLYSQTVLPTQCRSCWGGGGNNYGEKKVLIKGVLHIYELVFKI